MLLTWILLVCSVSQFAAMVYLSVRGRRMFRRVAELTGAVDKRLACMDELAAEHDELRLLFSGKAYVDLHAARLRMEGKPGAGPQSSDI